MGRFLGDDFLLPNDTAQTLFHEYAERMPILDYHCHLDPKEILENRKFATITDAWLGADHYKWRVMRACGIDEKLITGDAGPREKFRAYASIVPKMIGNPLNQWSHLELRRYFGIDEPLTGESADAVYDRCNAMLQQDDFAPQALIKRSRVTALCTTDPPESALEHHAQLQKSFSVRVMPTFRPDAYLNVSGKSFPQTARALVGGEDKITFRNIVGAAEERVDYFHRMGCRVSDHAVEKFVYREMSEKWLDQILKRRMDNESPVVTAEEREGFAAMMLKELSRMYAERGWTAQYHLSSSRNLNTPMFSRLGGDSGFDASASPVRIEDLGKFLDALRKSGTLPRSVFYSLHPGDNRPLMNMIGCFQGEAEMQLGSGWWFNDTLTGMRDQLTSLAELGVLGNFVGMLTDSRSFLSYPRHEYFRRILCGLIGEWVEKGIVDGSVEPLGKLVEDICYNNIAGYFGETE